MVAGVYSNDNNMQLEATTQFRKLLSIGIKSKPCFFFLQFLFIARSQEQISVNQHDLTLF